MMKGIVKWFNNKKGYGFITNEANEDVFVYWKDIQKEGYKDLDEGDEVTYDLKTDEVTGKIAAGNVVVINPAKKDKKGQK